MAPSESDGESSAEGGQSPSGEYGHAGSRDTAASWSACDVWEKTGLNAQEFDEAVQLFNKRIENANVENPGAPNDSLTIEDIDLILRKLNLFVSVRALWALFLEIDTNCNGEIDVEEFTMMVSKLRGKRPLSHDFYVWSLPRAATERFSKVFGILDSDEDGILDEEGMVVGCRQLNPHVDVEGDDFRHVLESLHGFDDGQFSLMDFIILQSKFRKQSVEVDVALLNLTDEEHAKFEQAFNQWRDVSTNRGRKDKKDKLADRSTDTAPSVSGFCVSPSELRSVLAQLGFPTSLDQIRRLMTDAELDSYRPIELKQFLFFLVHLGAGTSDQVRRILSPHSTYEQAFKLGFPLKDLWELGYDDLGELRRAGWSAQSVWKAGLAEAYRLREVGYSATDLRKVGCSARELKLSGYSMEDLRNAGFGSDILESVSNIMSRHSATCPHGEESGLQLRALGDNEAAAGRNEVHGRYGDMRWWSTPRIQSLLVRPKTTQAQLRDEALKLSVLQPRCFTAPAITQRHCTGL